MRPCLKTKQTKQQNKNSGAHSVLRAIVSANLHALFDGCVHVVSPVMLSCSVHQIALLEYNVTTQIPP